MKTIRYLLKTANRSMFNRDFKRGHFSILFAVTQRTTNS